MSTSSFEWIISGVGSKLWIENGGTLIAISAINISVNTTFQIDDGGTYKHQNTFAYEDYILHGTELFSTNSNFEINSSNTTGPGNTVFGNLIINLTSDPGSTVSLGGNILTINGNLDIRNTSIRELRISYNKAVTLTIAGDLKISGGVLNFSDGSTAGIIFIMNIAGNYNQTGGTFTHTNSGSGNELKINFTGTGKSFTQSGGTLTNTKMNWDINSGASYTLNNDLSVATSRTLTVNGTLDCSSKLVTGSGAFSLASGGTLKTPNTNGITSSGATGSIQTTTRSFSTGANYEYNGSSAQVTGGGLPSPVNDLKIDNSAGVTLTGSETVNGHLYLTNGALILTGTTVLTISDHLVVGNGSFSDGDNTEIIIDGTLDEEITPLGQSNGIPTVRNLTFWLPFDWSLKLYHDLRVTRKLKMVEGNLKTNGHTLILGSSADNPGELVYEGGKIIDTFTRWFAAGTNSLPVLFPIGIISNSTKYYRPASIKFTTVPTTGGTLTVQHFGTDPVMYNSGALNDIGFSLNRYSMSGYWQIDANGITGGNYDVTLSMDGITGVTNGNVDKLRIMKRSSTESNPPFVIDGSPGTNSGSYTNPTMVRIGLSGFSQFGIGSNSDYNSLDGALPVNLSSFNYSTSGNNVKLNWATAGENNNSGFDVERKTLSGTYTKIGFVKGKGTVNTTTRYSYEDKNLQTGKYKYRLKQIDYNGNFEYFELNGEVEVGVPNKFSISQNYPNPFNPSTKINFDLPADSKVTLVIYDVTGREVAKLLNNEFHSAGYYTAEFNASKFSSGAYFYSFTANNFRMTKRMIILK
ncbi:MAG: T9SS type A sorting domain-containing protein [Ignavibacteriae bacterium]|nr:T9SS type A sorting domain-containing protein [Ignavibacteriota bacterium]